MRAHRIRLNPTPDQIAHFVQACGVARFVYNAGLADYKAAKERGEKVDWNATVKMFRSRIESDFPFVRAVTKSVVDYAFMDLRKSISTYYKAKPTNAKLRFPSWRKRHQKIGSFGMGNDQFSVTGNKVRVPKLGSVRMYESLRYSGKIMSGRISEKAGRWYLTVTVEIDESNVAVNQSATGSVGIDTGLKQFATLSTGEVYENQTHFKRSERKLKLMQRGLSRKRRGSANYGKWKQRVSRFREHVAAQRRDFIHKTTTEIASKYAFVCVENLSLRGLVRTQLGKSFADVGIGEAVRQLGYKAGVLQKVDRFFPSSRLCGACGERKLSLKLSEREWCCTSCGTVHDRDGNAAKNIEIEGLRLLTLAGYVSETTAELTASTEPFGVRQVVAMKQESCLTR
jgi:putative transposase